MRKIYVVLRDFGDASDPVDAFLDEGLAILHAKELEKIESDPYWVKEIPLKDWREDN